MSSTIPRMHSHPNPYASTAYPQSTTSSTYGGGSGGGGGNFYSTRRDSYGYPTSTRGSGFPRLFKRLFKFPQMDFEVAIWEMTHLMVAPRKVFRNLYYQRQTKGQSSQSDPALPYLTALFQLLASLAWSLAYAPKHTLRILTSFLLLQYLTFTIGLAAFSHFLIPRLFGPRGWLKDINVQPASRILGRRKRGLFREAATADSEGTGELDFGYAIDVAVRTYVPLLVYLSLLQFLLMPLISTPSAHTHLSAVLSNILHAIAFTHALYVTFLGYSALPSLQNTQLLLVPGVAVVWALAVIFSAVGLGMTGRKGPIGWVPGLDSLLNVPPAPNPGGPPPPPPPPRLF